MKRTFKMKMLSFALAVITAVMLFPYGTLTASATENEPPIEEISSIETSEGAQDISDQPTTDGSAEDTEM